MLEYVARGDADGFYRQVVEEPARARAWPARAALSAGRAGSVALRRCTRCSAWSIARNGEILHYDQWIDRGGAGSVTFGCVVFD